MKHEILFTIALFATMATSNAQSTGTTGGWAKYEMNPVLGKEAGATYDGCVLKNEDGTYRMYYSLYEQFGIVMSESSDGISWGKPVVCLSTAFATDNWGQDISSPFVTKKDGIYHMWYTGIVWNEKAEASAGIGYATSSDGKYWERKSANPVLSAGAAWEKGSVLRAHVLWDEQEKLFRMWYSGGNEFEPEAIGYATSKDGLAWQKYHENPIFTANKQSEWEQAKVTDCRVIKRNNDYLMVYVGYSDAKHGEIGMARSKNGISDWERFTENPIIRHSEGAVWDSEAVYKPFILAEPENNRWLLYYNGRSAVHNDRIFEQIGVAIYQGESLVFQMNSFFIK